MMAPLPIMAMELMIAPGQMTVPAPIRAVGETTAVGLMMIAAVNLIESRKDAIELRV
ncbi:MAG TPA: hypothetical protein VGJ21_17645 [Terracidiphilus sp.]|jgi:hypothetical protein